MMRETELIEGIREALTQAQGKIETSLKSSLELVEKLSAEVNEALEKFENIDTVKNGLEVEIRNLQNTIETAKEELSRQKKTAEEREAKLKELYTAIDSTEKEITKVQEAIEQETHKKETMTKELEETKQKIQEMTEAITRMRESFESDVQKAREELEKQKEISEQIKEKYPIVSYLIDMGSLEEPRAEIISALSSAEKGLTEAELKSAVTSVPPVQVMRTLLSMETEGLIKKSDDGLYILGEQIANYMTSTP